MTRPVREYQWPSDRRRRVEMHDFEWLREKELEAREAARRVVVPDETPATLASFTVASPAEPPLHRKRHAGRVKAQRTRVATQRKTEKVAPIRPLPKGMPSGMPFIHRPVDHDAAIARAAEAM
jgi:hypothetical protein